MGFMYKGATVWALKMVATSVFICIAKVCALNYKMISIINTIFAPQYGKTK